MRYDSPVLEFYSLLGLHRDAMIPLCVADGACSRVAIASRPLDHPRRLSRPLRISECERFRAAIVYAVLLVPVSEPAIRLRRGCARLRLSDAGADVADWCRRPIRRQRVRLCRNRFR